MTTFDTESELSKVANEYPSIKLVLRVRCDDPEVSIIVQHHAAAVDMGSTHGQQQQQAGRTCHRFMRQASSDCLPTLATACVQCRHLASM